MNILNTRNILILVVLLFGLLSPSGYAQENKKTKQQNSASVIKKKDAIRRAKKSVDGRVLRVDQDKKKYRVKVLKKSGRVVSVDVDKRSGKVQKNSSKNNNKSKGNK